MPRWFADIASELGVPPLLLELTKRIVSELHPSAHRRRGGYVFLASLIMASRILGTPLTLKSVSQASARVGLRVSPKKLAIVVGEVSSVCKSSPAVSKGAQRYITSIISSLKRDTVVQSTLSDLFGEWWDVALDRLHVKSFELYRTAGETIRFELAGKSPVVTAAAAVWLAAKTLGLRVITQEVVARAAGVSSSALRRRAKLILQGLEAARDAR